MLPRWQKQKLTREQMTAWFEQFRHGDPANRDFQKRLIDTFVNAVYVFDDKLVLTYNYQHGTQTISLDEIASALSSDFDGDTPPYRYWTNTFFFSGGFAVKCRLQYKAEKNQSHKDFGSFLFDLDEKKVYIEIVAKMCYNN